MSVLIIEASAGSGKTYRLTLEFLIHLLRVTHRFMQRGSGELNSEIATILAITFTNKAANEMKERIIEQLKSFALMDDAEESPMFDAVSEETGFDRVKIRDYSSKILDAIVSHLGDFNVKTIDSLMASIIKVVSPDLNLPPGFEVSVDAKRELGRLSSEYIDYCADRRWEDIEVVLDMLRDMGQLNNWRPDEKIRAKLTEFFHQYMKSEEEQIFGALVSENLKGIRQSKLQSIGEALLKMSQIIKADRESKKKFLDGNKVRAGLIDEFADFNAFRDSDKADYIAEKSFFKKISGSELMSKKALAAGEFTEEQNYFNELYSEIRSDVEELIMVLSRERVAGYSVLFDGFREFWSSRRKNIYVEEFSKTLKDRIETWSREGCFPYIFLKLSERYQNFLFDEFQDTSRLQFRALSPVIEEVLTSEEKSSLFIVGDRKQAIYRWRGGSAELMTGEVLNHEFMDSVDSNSFSSQVLEFNWRSRREIVEFNNSFWTRGFEGEVENNFSTVFQNVPAKGGSNDGGYVKISFAEADESRDSREILCEEVYRMVDLALSKGYSCSDIAVLTRKKARGREVIQYLSTKGIKAISDESLFLSSSQVVNEIIAFLRFLELPSSNLIFNEFLNGVVLEKVLTPDERAQLREFLLTINRRERGKTIFALFTEKFPDIRERFIDPFLNSTGLIPVYDLFNDITRIFSIYENHEDETPFILTFGEYLHNLEAEGVSSVSSFLGEWDSSDSSGPSTSVDVTGDSESVRIMTLHKSKGLEFPVVIMPLADEKDMPDNIFMRDGQLYYISRKYADLNSDLDKIYREENLKKYIDEMNLLYVGFTRAVDMLLVPLMKPSKKSRKDDAEGTVFRGFANVVYNHPLIGEKISEDVESVSWGEVPGKNLLEVPGVSDLMKIPPRHVGTAGWQKKMLVYAASKYSGVENRESALRGEMIHEMMSGITVYDTVDSLKAALEKRFKDYRLREKENKSFIRFFTGSSVAPFFTGNWRVYNELDIAAINSTSEKPEKKRIDRIMVNDKEVVILDYKTGAAEKEEYAEQIRAYGKLALEMWSNRKLSLFLLYPDKEIVKEIIC